MSRAPTSPWNVLHCEICGALIHMDHASACAGRCNRVVCDGHLAPTPPPHGPEMCADCRKGALQ